MKVEKLSSFTTYNNLLKEYYKRIGTQVSRNCVVVTYAIGDEGVYLVVINTDTGERIKITLEGGE